MDRSLEQLKYVVYFRINDQESFCIRNLSLSDYIPLIHNDKHTVNYILSLITSGAIDNVDDEINAISRSKDNVNFESIDIDLSLQLEESLQIPEGMVLLKELEALPDNNVNAEADPATPSTQNKTFYSKLETLVGSPQRLQFSTNYDVMDTPPPHRSEEPSNIIKKCRVDTKPIAVRKLTALSRTNNERFQTEAGSLNGPSKTSKDALSVPSSRASSSSTPLATESTSTSADSIEATTCTMSGGVLKNRKLKSHVWNSFTKIDATTARCQICFEPYKHDGNTTNLQQHLTRKHPLRTLNTSIATESKQKTISQYIVASKRIRLLENDDPDNSPKKDTEMQRNFLRPVKPVSSDQQIDHVSRRAHSFADGETSEKITNAILYMLATDKRPLSFVENEGFRTFMKTIAPLYKIPSRRTIVRYMDEKYEHWRIGASDDSSDD